MTTGRGSLPEGGPGASSDLVSVIMPLYNCEAFVGEAVRSVISQTYENWELIVVDDCSTDGSLDVVAGYLDDRRIRVVRHQENRGASRARNTALRRVRGRYVAYMDADDVWMPGKLEHQLSFMARSGASMCFTSYETIEEDGAHRNFVHVPATITYRHFLKNTLTCSHTIMFDLSVVDVAWLLTPEESVPYDFPEDLDTWLRVLKHGVTGYGLDSIEAKNRKHGSSRSANHLAAVHRTWNQYRRRENLPFLYSCYCLFWQLYHAVRKRM